MLFNVFFLYFLLCFQPAIKLFMHFSFIVFFSFFVAKTFNYYSMFFCSQASSNVFFFSFFLLSWLYFYIKHVSKQKMFSFKNVTLHFRHTKKWVTSMIGEDKYFLISFYSLENCLSPLTTSFFFFKTWRFIKKKRPNKLFLSFHFWLSFTILIDNVFVLCWTGDGI